MENRDRDQMSRNNQSTSAGNVNRNTSSQIGKEKSDSTAEFGQKVGRSENLNEPNSRGSRSGSSGYDSSRGRDSSSSDDSRSSSGIGSSSSGGSKQNLPGNRDDRSSSGGRH